MSVIRFKPAPIASAAQPDSRTLTAREEQVLRLARMTNADIASVLLLSLSAVREAWYGSDERPGILAKLGADNRTHALELWRERGEDEMERARRAA